MVNEAVSKFKFPYYEGYLLNSNQSKSSRQLVLSNIGVSDFTKRTSFQTFDECKEATQQNADLNKDEQWIIVEQTAKGQSEIVWIRMINGKEIDLRK